MAQVTVQNKDVQVVQPIKSVNIELTLDEAQELVAILGAGAGLVDGLYFKLNALGVTTGKYLVNINNGHIKVDHNRFMR